MLSDQESMKSKVLKDILKKQDIMIDLGKVGNVEKNKLELTINISQVCSFSSSCA